MLTESLALSVPYQTRRACRAHDSAGLHEKTAVLNTRATSEQRIERIAGMITLYQAGRWSNTSDAMNVM